jgi:iron complex outermembrane recepter protein
MKRTLGVAALAAVCSLSFAEQEAPQKGQDLSHLGLEDLMKIEVTTASKSAQPWLNVPAAVYVLTNEEIRRSGATNVPDALRLVPGVHVAQVDASKWMVSIRGFSSRFANKLLVLIDGRTVYTPLFSGVYWDTQDVVLEDVDRIEVIRGPGATLWGANAVNGIINIITKSAAETQGTLVSALAGTEERVQGTIRHGGQISDETFYRVYARYVERDSSRSPLGGQGSDRWSATQGGVRLDWENESGDRLVMRGDVRGGTLGQTTNRPVLAPPYVQPTDDRYHASSYSGLARYETQRAGGSTGVQLYFERSIRNAVEIEESRSTFDLDVQHAFPSGGAHTFMVGAGYRQTQDRLGSTALVSVRNPERTDRLWSAFVQDEIRLSRKAGLTLGVKLEHNDYSGVEVQPNARLSYQPNSSLTLWGSLARAARTPSRVEHDATLNILAGPAQGGLSSLVSISGSPRFDSESVIAYEAGARWQATDRLLLDAALFYNSYRGLRAFQAGTPFMQALPVPHIVVPYTFVNGLSGHTAGFELMAQAQITDRWRISGSYSFLDTKLRLDPTIGDPFGLYGGDGRGTTPKHMLKLQSYTDLGRGLEFDAAVYYFDATTRGLAAYWKGDVHIGWAPSPRFRFDLGIQNIFAPKQLQSNEALFERIHEVERGLYVRATWRF